VADILACERSLCFSCTFVKQVTGRHQQTYLLCRNETIEAKYPRQPVLTCSGFVRQDRALPDANSAPDR
jgi:hypothetical protein